VAQAGGLGSYGARILMPDEITTLVAELHAATSRAFAVNLWVPQPSESDLPAGPASLAPHIDRLRPFLIVSIGTATTVAEAFADAVSVRSSPPRDRRQPGHRGGADLGADGVQIGTGFLGTERPEA
jgi:NAD(P)H-dependent flavin oxidoreductase YrpB (nitropropane dioxygenase family)